MQTKVVAVAMALHITASGTVTGVPMTASTIPTR
jgi:hypothetical protein